MTKADAITLESIKKVRLLRAGAGHTDLLVGEAPLQITLNGRRFAVLMRTPFTSEYSDIDLVTGFLLSEGVIEDWDDFEGIGHCTDPANPNQTNIVIVRLRSGCALPKVFREAKRATVVSSSCGVCGRMGLDELLPALPPRPQYEKPAEDLIRSLPDRLRSTQQIFELTGGIHGAGLFDEASGRIIFSAEDIGRHNAMDKLVGRAIRLERNELQGGIVVVSSRLSFDLVQKALMAGVSALVGVGAASDLAHELAFTQGLHLFSFTKSSTTNYHLTT